MFEQSILKQIFIFNLEAKTNKMENGLKKASLVIALEKIRKEAEE